MKNLLYIILIEEIRFINFSENLINLLKMAAFWIKALSETKLHREELLPYSAFSSVIAYRRDVARRFLKRSISYHRRYDIPFSLVRFRGNITEENMRKLSSTLRLYDELFLTGDDEGIACISMTTEENAQFVIKRLMNILPAISFETVSTGSRKRKKDKNGSSC